MSKKSGIPVLVTGFGPFGTHKVNVSWEVAKVLTSLNLESQGVQLTLQEIPVAYEYADEEVPRLWKRHKPQLVVHMGLTSIGSEISLETVAHKNGYHKLDIYGKLPENGSAKGKYDVLRTKLNVQEILDVMLNSPEIDVPIKVSTDAGRYLCEYVFYTSLNIDNSRTIFVHIPDTNKGFTVLQMALVVKKIIILLLEQLFNELE